MPASSSSTSSCGSASATRPSRPSMRLGVPERVQHRLLGRVHGGREAAGRRRRPRAARRRARAAWSRTRGRSRRCRGGPPSRCARARARRGAPGASSWAESSGASVATTTMQLPPARRGPAGARSSSRPTGHAVHAQVRRRAEVRQHQHADRRVAGGTRLAVPIPPFQSKHTIPVPGAHGALGERPRPAACQRARPASAASTCTTRASFSQLSSHSPTTGITTSSTPTRGSAATAARHRAVVHAPDRHRGGEVDGRLEHAPLADLRASPSSPRRRSARRCPPRTGSAPQRRPSSRGRIAVTPRARHAAPGGRIGLVAHHRHVAHPHAGHVGDRVARARLERADPQAVVAQAASWSARSPSRVGSPAVGLAMPVVWSDRHRLHDPGGEVWVGVHTPGTELPERAERIRADAGACGGRRGGERGAAGGDAERACTTPPSPTTSRARGRTGRPAG